MHVAVVVVRARHPVKVARLDRDEVEAPVAPAAPRPEQGGERPAPPPANRRPSGPALVAATIERETFDCARIFTTAYLFGPAG